MLRGVTYLFGLIAHAIGNALFETFEVFMDEPLILQQKHIEELIPSDFETLGDLWLLHEDARVVALECVPSLDVELSCIKTRTGRARQPEVQPTCNEWYVLRSTPYSACTE